MARDYRSFNKYDIEDIYFNKLESKEWLGKRMAFLWECREYYTNTYLKNNLSTELQCEFYAINDSEVARIASEDYHCDYVDYGMSDNEVIEELNRLETLKNNNRSEFLLRKNSRKYDYCSIEYSKRELYRY